MWFFVKFVILLIMIIIEYCFLLWILYRYRIIFMFYLMLGYYIYIKKNIIDFLSVKFIIVVGNIVNIGVY